VPSGPTSDNTHTKQKPGEQSKKRKGVNASTIFTEPETRRKEDSIDGTKEKGRLSIIGRGEKERAMRENRTEKTQ